MEVRNTEIVWKYNSKQKQVKAIQTSNNNIEKCLQFINDNEQQVAQCKISNSIKINSHQGIVNVPIGNYIFTSSDGNFWHMSSKDFDKNFTVIYEKSKKPTYSCCSVINSNIGINESGSTESGGSWECLFRDEVRGLGVDPNTTENSLMINPSNVLLNTEDNKLSLVPLNNGSYELILNNEIIELDKHLIALIVHKLRNK